MKDSIIFEGREFISVSRAAEITKYTKDYVGQLCRGGKVAARMIGRTWFVDRESILVYKTSAETFFENYGKQKDMVVPSARVNTRATTLKHVGDMTNPQVSVSPVASGLTTSAVSDSAPIVQNLNYTPDERPLMPRLSKVADVSAESLSSYSPTVSTPQIRQSQPVGLVKENSELISANVLRIKNRTHTAKPSNLRGMRTALVTFILVAFVFSGSVGFFYAYKNFNQTTQVAVDSRVDNTASVGSFLGAISDFVKNMFGIKPQTLAVNVEKPPPRPGGIAIVPSSNSKTQDELIKQKIQDSFSDEIRVTPDESGTAGVITPVFRKATGDSFVYVLVPVEDRAPIK